MRRLIFGIGVAVGCAPEEWVGLVGWVHGAGGIKVRSTWTSMRVCR